MNLQFEVLQREQPFLRKAANAQEATITGRYCLNHILNGEVFNESFSIKAIVPNKFPQGILRVWEIGERIPSEYEHIYQDKELCLEVNTRIVIELTEHPTLVYFFQHFVDAYFLSFLYHERHNKFPFGERSHGITGILEYYYDKFNVNKDVVALRLLKALYYGGPNDSSAYCPCGSKISYAHCHKETIERLQNSRYRPLYFSDFRDIQEMVKCQKQD
jgi:hypothetical protein